MHPSTVVLEWIPSSPVDLAPPYPDGPMDFVARLAADMLAARTALPAGGPDQQPPSINEGFVREGGRVEWREGKKEKEENCENSDRLTMCSANESEGMP